MRTDVAEPIRLVDYRVSDYLIDAVELDISLHPTATRVQALLRMRPNPEGRAGTPLILDGDELVCRGVRLDGEEMSGDGVLVTPDQLVLHTPPQHAFVLEITTEINPSANTRLMGLYRSGAAYCTQCEAEGFRRITYFLDRPDVLSIYTVRLEGDRSEAPLLLSNGNRLDEGSIDANRHFALWHDPFPKPSYLFALVGGDLGALHDTFKTRSGRDVALGIYVEHGKEASAHYAMDALKRSMAWDETAFGREYDLDLFNIVAVSDFNMGAMENKGLNVFNDKYVLASPETATDTDYAGIETVIAHEYFHNWTGNRITCRDWFQLCLKEGLTVFRDHEFSADMRSRPCAPHCRRACLARAAISGGCRPTCPQCAARHVSRDQQFLHRDDLRKGLRSHPHAESADRRQGVSRRHGSLLRSMGRNGDHDRGLHHVFRRNVGSRPRDVFALVSSIGHAASRSGRQLQWRRTNLHARSQAILPADAGPVDESPVRPAYRDGSCRRKRRCTAA